MFTNWLLKPAVLMTLTVIAPVTDEPRVLWVDANACPGMGSGTDADPFCSIQVAYDNSADGDEIRVRAGTYEECVQANDPDSPKTVRLIADSFDPASPETANLTAIDGSGVPGCAPWSQNNPIVPEVAVIELGGAGSSLTGFRVTGGGDRGVRALGSVTISHNVIDNNEAFAGAGITVLTNNCIYGETVTLVSNNVIRGNYGRVFGGGIQARVGRDNYANPPDIDCPGEGRARLAIVDNSVEQNWAGDRGAGIYVRTFAASEFSADVVITRNTISGNLAPPHPSVNSDGWGAGIYALTIGGGRETIVISENIIEDNYALSAGGGLTASVFTRELNEEVNLGIEIVDNVIRRNTAGWGGAGMELGVGGPDHMEPQLLGIVARDNLIEENVVSGEQVFAFSQPGGGGVSTIMGSTRSSEGSLSLQLINNRIRNNISHRQGGGVSALAWAESGTDESGAPLPASSRIEIIGNLIDGNVSHHDRIDSTGGGAELELRSYNQDAQTEIVFALNTVVVNVVNSEDTGGGVHIDSGTVIPFPDYTVGTGHVALTSNIIADNHGIGVEVTPPEFAPTETRGYGTDLSVDVAFCDVVGNSGGDYGDWLGDLTGIDGNISVNPRFVDPAGGDFHITGESSVVDAGEPSPPSATPKTDLDGDPRIVDGNRDGTPTADMGYDEWVPPVIEVAIDIKPDSDHNTVNPRSRGVIPVALMGSAEFDVTTIDAATLLFGPDGAALAHGSNGSSASGGHLEDVDLDGHVDLMTHFRTQETGIVCGNSSVTLIGQTFDGSVLRGTDTISTVGCPSGGRDRNTFDFWRDRELPDDRGLLEPERQR